MLLEDAERIGLEHLCPFVTIVACCIAPRHDMRELYRHAGVGQLLGDHRLLPGLFLEGDDILVKRLLAGIVSHIKQAETDLTHAGIGHIEVTAPDDTVDQFVRQGLARLVMESKGAQKVFLDREVLHEL